MNLWNNYLEQAPSWHASSRIASQEIRHFVQNPKFHYRVHNGPLTYETLCNIS
jgi:hypothetical protein